MAESEILQKLAEVDTKIDFVVDAINRPETGILSHLQKLNNRDYSHSQRLAKVEQKWKNLKILLLGIGGGGGTITGILKALSIF